MRCVNGNSIDICAQLESWYTAASGRYLLEHEREIVRDELRKVYGHSLLQVGIGREQSLPVDDDAGHFIYTAPALGGDVGLVSESGSLPFADDSMDAVVLHHALEFASDPHGLLREAYRVLAPQGHLLIVGFNPFSLFGLACILRRYWPRSLWRFSVNMSSWRIRDWLQLLGGNVQSVRHCYAIPPFGGERLFRYSSACEAFATQRNWPLGGVYVVRARKDVATLTPRRMRWKKSVGNKLIDLTVPRPVPSPREGDVAA